MKQSVRAITVSPEFWWDDPARAATLLSEKMGEHDGTDLWIVCIGPIDSASRIMGDLFMYGPAEPPLDPPSPSATSSPASPASASTAGESRASGSAGPRKPRKAGERSR